MNSHVLYFAFGSYRVRAAREHVKELAASGAQIVLVVPDTDDWTGTSDEVSRLDGVDVVRLASDKHGSVAHTAKKLILSKSGPLASADLLIVGDAQALPTAWAAMRRRPGLKVQLEPYDSVGPFGPADLAVITPWYPSPNNPYAGAFVKMATSTVADRFERVSIIHTEDWSGPASPPLNDAIKITTERLQQRRELAPVLKTSEGTLLRVPVPLIHRRNYEPWVKTQETALSRALPENQIQAPVIHAHTGIYGGVLAMRLAQPDARIVVTEHSTFLNKVFAQPTARSLYSDVLKRADAFLCVSSYLRDQIAAEFPEFADKLQIVPNVVDFDSFTPGPERSPDLLKWLYVGRLVKHKGVNELLEAFAQVASEEPDVTLTMVGSGACEEELIARKAELGLGDRFRILPPVAPEEVHELMRRHDLLVHASKIETFGMTIVEAVATGLPVLVTRSHGPEETLSGIEAEAGALMDVSDDPQVIADAFWELRARVSELDLPSAREHLKKQYGADAVAELLMDAYQGRNRPSSISPAPEATTIEATAVKPQKVEAPVTEPTGRAVLLAFSPARPRRVADFATHLLDRGVHVTLVTARSQIWQRAHLDARVVLVNIEDGERKLIIPRGERFLVYRTPRAALRKVRGVTRRSRSTITPELAVASVQRMHAKVANAFHKRIFNRGYREVRPQLLSRIARKNALPGLRLDLTDHVFVCDINSTVTGWKWAKSYPNLTVTTDLDRTLYGTSAE